MYHVELINELYPQTTNPLYKNICKIVVSSIMITFLSGWIGYIIGNSRCGVR